MRHCCTFHPCFILKALVACNANTDVHYRTFDGTPFTYQGLCKYNQVSKSNPAANIPDFELLTKNEVWYGWSSVSWMRYAELRIFGSTIRVDREPTTRQPLTYVRPV